MNFTIRIVKLIMYIRCCTRIPLTFMLKLQLKSHDKFLMGNPMTELQGVACHMGSHSVTCYPTQLANAPRLNPSQ